MWYVGPVDGVIYYISASTAECRADEVAISTDGESDGAYVGQVADSACIEVGGG